MKNNNINDLLNKYWDAETSVEEEVILKSYFKSSEVAPEHKGFLPMFQAFDLEKQINADHIELHQKTNTVQDAKVVQISKTWKAIAAIFVLALASVFVFKSEIMNTQTTKATIVKVEDPEEALEYTKMALAMLSKSYRKGTTELATGMDNVNKMNIIK